LRKFCAGAAFWADMRMFLAALLDKLIAAPEGRRWGLPHS
jgi:hypothetical protein